MAYQDLGVAGLVVDLVDVRYLVDALNRGSVLILDQLQADQRRAAMEARRTWRTNKMS